MAAGNGSPFWKIIFWTWPLLAPVIMVFAYRSTGYLSDSSLTSYFLLSFLTYPAIACFLFNGLPESWPGGKRAMICFVLLLALGGAQFIYFVVCYGVARYF